VSVPPYKIEYSETAAKRLEAMRQKPAQYERKLRKIAKAIKLLTEQGPAYPGLQTHKMEAIPGPNGKDLWNSYVENNTPSAWRVLWVYGDEGDVIEIVSIGPHD
jgi:mRNA-degrading endonuclease YafQ of YafQ-DinJ toxin-antitoxin module